MQGWPMQAQMQRIRAALPESALQEELLGWEDELEAAATPAQLKSLLGSLEAGLAEEGLSTLFSRTPKLVALAWPALGEPIAMLLGPVVCSALVGTMSGFTGDRAKQSGY